MLKTRWETPPTMAPHFHLLFVFLTTLSLLHLFKQYIMKKYANKPLKKLPPGPKKLPIIGNLHQLGSMPHHSLYDLSTKYGPLMLLQLGSIPTLVVSSADEAAEIIKAHDITFSARPALYAAKKFSYNLSDVAFAPYGEYWRQARKICVIKLLSAKRVQSFRAVREEEVGSMISSMKESPSSLNPINLSEMMISLTCAITCRMAFGKKNSREFHSILAKTQRMLGGFCTADFFPWLQWVHALTGLRARMAEIFEELDGFFNQVIEEHLTSLLPEEQDAEDLVHILLRHLKDSTYGVTFSSMDHVKGIITDIFLAGTDTSSATIIWAMTELMRNPSLMNKLQQEVRNVGGSKSIIEDSDLEQLDYLKLVIKEVLRLHPPAPLLVPRETIGMCRIKEYEIPAKTRVFINAKAIAMDPKYWENPEEFQPERFIGNDIQFGGQDFKMVPFGVGRRSCPGVSSAMAVVELALANLVFCFDWGLPKGMEAKDLDLEEAFGLAVHKKNPLCHLLCINRKEKKRKL